MSQIDLPSYEVPIEIVDRGNPVTIDIALDHDPEEVYFCYLKPGEEQPTFDAGFGQPGSFLVQTAPGMYRYVIETTDWPLSPPDAWWHFWGVDENRHAVDKWGRLWIRGGPQQML